MRSDNKDRLRNAVERLLDCKAHATRSVSIIDTFDSKTMWEGVVHVFDLTEHPSATRAYAWSSPIKGSHERRYCAVLHVAPVTSPIEAVRAAAVLEHWAIEE
jgi:hypothetical protein